MSVHNANAMANSFNRKSVYNINNSINTMKPKDLLNSNKVTHCCHLFGKYELHYFAIFIVIYIDILTFNEFQASSIINVMYSYKNYFYP